MATITVGPSGRDYTSVQAAINVAVAGDEIVLDSGVTFTESLALPSTNHNPPVVIRSSTAAPDRRVAASDAGDMATLTQSYAAESAIVGEGVRGWTFQFIRLHHPSPQYYYVLFTNANLGGGVFRNNERITFDRCLVEGGTTDGPRIALRPDGAVVVDRCYIHNIRKAGEESKAILVLDGPGPFTINDSFLEAACINILFGGGNASSEAHIIRNVTYTNNDNFKRLSWVGAGVACKNLFEFKHVSGALVENNTFTNCWHDSQDGTGILFQALNDDGGSPYIRIEDVVFRNNEVRNVLQGISLNGHDWSSGHDTIGMERITFENNIFEIDSGRFLMAGAEVKELTVSHNTIINNTSPERPCVLLTFGGIAEPGGDVREAEYAVRNYVFRDNLIYRNAEHQGEYGLPGTAGLEAQCSGYTMSHNVFAGSGTAAYPPNNQFPSIATYESNFVDLIDYELTPGSAYRNAASDGLNLGHTGGTALSASNATAHGTSTAVGVSVALSSGIVIGTATNNGFYEIEHTSVSWFFNAGGHPLLVVARGDYSVDDVTGATYNGVAMTFLGKAGVAGARWTYLYGLMNPATGNNTVTVTATNAHFLYGCAVSYQGVQSFGPVTTAVEGTPNTNFSLGLTTTQPLSWVASAIGSEEANFFPGVATTLRSRFGTFLDPGFVDNNTPVAASTAVTLEVFTSGANRWAGIAVELIAGLSTSGIAIGTSTAAAVGRAESRATGIATASSTATAVMIGSTDQGDIVPATFMIGGVPQGVRSGTLRISESLNARNVLSCEVVSMNGTYRPADGAEVMYTFGVDRVFGGLIDLPTERGLVNQMGTRIVNGVNTVDFNCFADRRHINGIITAGSLKAALQMIVPYLSDYGVTLDPLQVDGPAVPLLYLPTRLIRDVFDELSVMTGYAWEIDYHRVLRMFMPGSIAAPFNVIPNTNPSVITGDITVETVRTDYANRIILLAGSGILETTQAFVGDGTTRVFPLRVAVTGIPTTVTVNGVPVTVGTHGVDTALEWTLRYSDNAIVQLDEAPPGTAHSPITGADTLSVVYAGQYPYQVVANDLAAQAPPRGVWEKVYQADKTFEPDAAQALADGYLPKHVTSFQGVRYSTRRQGLKPGQTQTITVPQRNLSGTFLITDIETSDTADQQFQYVVTAVGGTVIPPSWRDFFRQGGGVTGGSATPVAGGGGGGGGVTVGQTFYLGGSRNTSVAPNPAAWMPVPDYVKHAALASSTGRVRADCWAREAGTSVQLRLRNMTDATTVAASPVVTSTTPTEVTFDAAITVGKTYRLEAIPSVNGSGVYGIGSLESL